MYIYTRRYLESAFAVTPEVAADGSNLADVCVKMWSAAAEDPCPEKCLLGERTLYVGVRVCEFVRSQPVTRAHALRECVTSRQVEG